jgi:hypothetical protein
VKATESVKRAGIAQMVERQPSKLRVAGSNPVSRSIFLEPVARTLPKMTGQPVREQVFSFLFGPRSSVGGALPW